MHANSKYRYRHHRCHASGKKNISTLYRTTMKCLRCNVSHFNKTTYTEIECFNCGLAIQYDDPYIRIKPWDAITFGTPEQYTDFVNEIIPILTHTGAPLYGL